MYLNGSWFHNVSYPFALFCPKIAMIQFVQGAGLLPFSACCHAAAPATGGSATLWRRREGEGPAAAWDSSGDFHMKISIQWALPGTGLAKKNCIFDSINQKELWFSTI